MVGCKSLCAFLFSDFKICTRTSIKEQQIQQREAMGNQSNKVANFFRKSCPSKQRVVVKEDSGDGRPTTSPYSRWRRHCPRKKHVIQSTGNLLPNHGKLITCGSMCL